MSEETVGGWAVLDSLVIAEHQDGEIEFPGTSCFRLISNKQLLMCVFKFFPPSSQHQPLVSTLQSKFLTPVSKMRAHRSHAGATA